MYCVHCGKQLPDTAKFCVQCGKAVTPKTSTYSYAYKKANTPPNPNAEAESTTYSYKKEDIPAGSASAAQGGTYRHVYNQQQTAPPPPPPKVDTAPKAPPTAATKTPTPPKTDPKPASSQSGNGNSGCLIWILILVGLYMLYGFVIKPRIQKKNADTTTPSSSVVVQEETKSQEALTAERLPGIPEELYDLPIFKNRAFGNCTALEGDVAVTVLFMNDWESSWNQEDMDIFLSSVYDVCQDLTYEASQWGKDVNFTVYSTQGYADEAVDPASAHLNFASFVCSTGFEGAVVLEYAQHLQEQTQAEKVPVIVAFNKWGRSYASPSKYDYSVEECYIFDDISALKHELLHLFGATDFYYHDSLDQAAHQYLGGSIMASSHEAMDPVDDMTAYLIGWTDRLTDNATSFMYAAAAVGTDAMKDASQQNTLSGYFTNITLRDGSLFTGTLSNGTPVGTGERTWPNGDHFYGEWDQGRMVSGTLTWANGDTFTGEWENGERVYGTYVWTNGSVYTGQFQNNEMHGQGTITYYNGQTQSGYWENGEFIG